MALKEGECPHCGAIGGHRMCGPIRFQSVAPSSEPSRKLLDWVHGSTVKECAERIGRAEDRIAELAALVELLRAERKAAQEYALRLRQVIYAGDPKIRARADLEIDEMSLASVLESARGKVDAALAAPSGVKPHTGFPYDGTENQAL